MVIVRRVFATPTAPTRGIILQTHIDSLLLRKFAVYMYDFHIFTVIYSPFHGFIC